MFTFETDLTGLKTISKDFLDVLPSANLDEVEAGWKCVSLAFSTQQDVDAFLACHGKTSACSSTVQHNDDTSGDTTYVKPLNRRNKI